MALLNGSAVLTRGKPRARALDGGLSARWLLCESGSFHLVGPLAYDLEVTPELSSQQATGKK